MRDNKLSQAERLCGKTRIEALFTSGNSFIVYPFRVVYLSPCESSSTPVSMFVSVPKKKFKRAVKRNLIRRRVKEAYRLNKQILTEPLQKREQSLDMAILYLDKEIQEYPLLEKKIKELLTKLEHTLHTGETTRENSSKQHPT